MAQEMGKIQDYKLFNNHSKASINHQDIATSSILELWMTNTPNQNCGK